ncbi:hypothetical protein EMCRGX_G018175 [Ephydatia muelleri]
MRNSNTMEVDRSYYPYPPSAGSNFAYEGEQDFEAIIRGLFEKKQRLLHNHQNSPYQRHEIESQLRTVERELAQYQQQLGVDISVYATAFNPTPKMVGNTYMSPVDSAIGSGVATKAPSVGRGSVQSRGERVRTTMFPETIQEREEAPPTTTATPTQPQVLPGQQQQTNLQRMAQSSQVLTSALANLLAYQGSSELTAQVLPDLIKLLLDQEESVMGQASQLLHELSKKEPSAKAIVLNPSAVNAIFQAVTSTSNAELQKSLSGTVHNLSNDRQGLLAIYNCGGIPYLVRLLGSQVDGVLFYAITTLHNLLMHYEPAKMDVRLAGGLQKMVALLVKDNPKFLAIATDCLHILAYGHQDSKLIILANGGPAYLVRLMKLYTYEKLLWTCSRLLKVLSVCSSNKPEIVQAGGMQALGMHLGHRSSRLVQNILFTLRNLSDAATKQDQLDDLLRHLILLLSSADATIVKCCAGVLSNLTCNNAKNKTIVCHLHGVEALLRCLAVAGSQDEIVEVAVCTLRHVTSRHPNAEMAQAIVRSQNGVPLLLNMMQPQARWPVVLALTGLIRNLSLSHECHAILRDHSCVPRLWHYINKAYQEMQRRAGQGSPPVCVDGVFMDEVMEVCVATVHLLARDVTCRAQLRQLNCVPLVVQLLYSQSENIVRVAAGVLCEMVLDPEGAMMIEKENASIPLTELLQSHNEAIAAYAAAVLFCLSEGDSRRTVGSQGPFYRQEQHMMNNGYYGMGGMAPTSSGMPVAANQMQQAQQVYMPQAIPGLLTSDLDFDFDALDEFSAADTIHPFANQSQSQTPYQSHSHTPYHSQSHTPSYHTPQHSNPISGHSTPGYNYGHHGYNPPTSPAAMETAPGGAQWFDSDL